MRLPALCLAALITLPALAQTTDTLGGTNVAATRTNSAKASVFRVDSPVLLFDYEMYLNIPGPENLTVKLYRHHSRSGPYTEIWSQTVAVTGTGVPAWYSLGPVAQVLVPGNYYMLAVGWPGTLTYYYNTSATNAPTTFGAWQRAHTLTMPLPTTFSVSSGHDSAQYHQRLTTLPFGGVTRIGTGCTSSALQPRLVATSALAVNSTQNLELVDAAANSLGVFAVALGSTTPVATPLFGCDVWLNLQAPLSSTAVITSAAGYASLPMTIPNDPTFAGLQLSAQAGALATAIDMTNALDFIVQ